MMASDEGRFAALAGYDALDAGAHNYLILLNRGKLTVQKDHFAG
jgi:hypothetical protein